MNEAVFRKVTSRTNPQFKRWAQLLESRGVKKHRQALVCGERIVQELLPTQRARCLEILYPQGWKRPLKASPGVSHYRLARPLFDRLDLFGTGTPLLNCQTPRIGKWHSEENPNGLEFLCPLGDPSNVGALIRTCQAFGVQRVILLEEAASPFHPKAIRASSGAVFQTTFWQGPSLHHLPLDTPRASIVALEVKGKTLSTFIWPKNVRLLIGEEGQGLPPLEFLESVSIPMVKGMHSLNAVVAGSIGMYAYRVQHPLEEKTR